MRKALGALALAVLLAFSAAALAAEPLFVLDHQPDGLLMTPDGGLVYAAVTEGAAGSSYVTALIALDSRGLDRWQAPLAPAIPGGTQLEALPGGGYAVLCALPFGRWSAAGFAAEGQPSGPPALLPEGAVFPALLDGAVCYTRYQGYVHPDFSTSGHDGMWRLPLCGQAERLSFPGQSDLTSLTGMLRSGGRLFALARDEAFAHALLCLEDDLSLRWRCSLPGAFSPSRFFAALSPQGQTLAAFNLFTGEGQEACLLLLDASGQEIAFSRLHHDGLPGLRVDHLTALKEGGYLLLGRAWRQGDSEARAFELRLDGAGQITATRWHAAGVRLWPGPLGTLALLRDLERIHTRDANLGYDAPPWCLLKAEALDGPDMGGVSLQPLP